MTDTDPLADQIEQAAEGYWGKYRAGMREAARIVRAHEAEPPESREALWTMWTAGEKLAYGCGYRDARAALASPETE